MGGGLLPHTFPQLLGAASVFLANLSECKPLIHSMFAKACRHLWFLITKRMLDLFRRATDPPEYGWLYAIPATIFAGGFAWAASTGLGGLVAGGYFVSTMLSIAALSGLSSQVS
jgi:NAD(P) transhydrogenase